MIFNQFEEFGNYLWHHEVTGPALLEMLEQVSTQRYLSRLHVGDRLRRDHRQRRLFEKPLPGQQNCRQRSPAMSHPAQQRLRRAPHEGIGDKHVPWIHNVKNTDMVVAIDDEATISLDPPV